MRAGLLRETIHICKLVRTTSDSGAPKKEYIESYTIKASRKKLSASVGKGVNANEEFIGNTLVFQTRKYAFINEDILIKYRDNIYEVKLLDLQLDNTYIITCYKKND